MLRRNAVSALVISIVLPVLALSACSSSGSTTSPTAAADRVVLGQEFSLSTGKTVSVADEGFEIRFVEVVSDSRCPQGVTCIWAGEVSSLVEFKGKGDTGATSVVLTQSGSTTQTAKQVLDKYAVTFRVDPYPVAGKQIDKSEYRLVMTVTRSGQSDLEIRPAPIHEVTVSIAKSKPPQIIVYVKGGLRDGCTTFNGIETNRAGTTVTISVTTKRPKDAICPAIYGYFEQTVNLGSDFVPGQVYTFRVNDYVTTFQYPL